MSDSQLQALERAWRASGAFADEVAFLSESVRSGAVTHERASLAALCGSLAAAQALGLTPDLSTPDGLVVALRSVDREVDARGCAALGRAAAETLRPLRNGYEPRFDVSLIEATCSALEAWILDPTPESAARVERASRASYVTDLRPVRQSPHTAWMIAQPLTSAVASSASMLLLHTVMVLSRETDTPQPFPTIRPVLEREFAPWLLGTGDPLRARA